MSALNKSLACIVKENHKPMGGGVVISARHVLSCAHVIADSLSIPRTQAELPKGVVWLMFPLLGEERLFSARVMYWVPVKRDNRVEDIGDIAVLELIEM